MTTESQHAELAGQAHTAQDLLALACQLYFQLTLCRKLAAQIEQAAPAARMALPRELLFSTKLLSHNLEFLDGELTRIIGVRTNATHRSQ